MSRYVCAECRRPRESEAARCEHCGVSAAPVPVELREQLVEFNQAMGLPAFPGEPVVDPEPKRVLLMARHMVEELFELLAASIEPASRDELEAIRAQLVAELSESEEVLVDLPRVRARFRQLERALGLYHADLEIQPEPIGVEVHLSNMSKLWPNGKPRHDATGKLRKPPEFRPPDIRGELEKQGWKGSRE